MASNGKFTATLAISDTPRHGYEIIKLIETRLSGAHAPSPGIVNPTLTLLEEMGFAAVTVEGTRKLYAITEEGKRDLETHRAVRGPGLVAARARACSGRVHSEGSSFRRKGGWNCGQ